MLVLPPFCCAPVSFFFFLLSFSVWDGIGSAGSPTFCSLDNQKKKDLRGQSPSKQRKCSNKLPNSSSCSRDAELADTAIFQLGRRSMQ